MKTAIHKHIYLLGMLIALGIPAGGREYVALEEHLETIVPPDLEFIAEDSASVRLGDLVDRPTLISPVYYNCPGL